MKRICLLALTLALTACGHGEDNKPAAATSNPLGDGNSPSVIVPENARVSDYTCVEARDFIDEDGNAKHGEGTTQGTISYWKDSGFSYSFDESSSGTTKSLSKYQQYTLEGGKFRKTEEATAWVNGSNGWLKSVTNSVQIWQKSRNTLRNISNIVDGVDSPIDLEITETNIDPRHMHSAQHHTNPALRDRDGLHFTKIEVSCDYVDR